MKFEFDIDCDEVDTLVIKALQESTRNCSEVSGELDKKYARKYRKAVNRILRHFGGKQVED